jgi:hypothetical protein
MQSVSVKPTNSNHSGERSSPAGSTKTGGSKGGPSLMDLIDSGLLQPGYDNMKVTYKGTTYAGALQGNGTILFRGAQALWQQLWKQQQQHCVSSSQQQQVAPKRTRAS